MKRNQSWGKALRALGHHYSWPILISLGVFGLLLGSIGFLKHGLSHGEFRSVWDNLYLTLGLISMNTGAVEGPVSWQLEIARFLVPAVAAYSAFKAFAAIFIEQTNRFRLLFIRDHVLICGLGRKGYRLAEQFQTQGDQVVVIEVNESNEWIQSARSSGVIVIQGDATDELVLQSARVRRARYLISVLGDDGLNAEIAVQAEELTRGKTRDPLTCIIHIYNSQLWHYLREMEMNTLQGKHFRLELFNTFDIGAKRMLHMVPLWTRGSDRAPFHVLLVGLGKMGESLVLELSRHWRRTSPQSDERLRLSVVDREAETLLDTLLTRYPKLTEIVDIRALTMDIHSAEFQRLDQVFVDKGECKLDVAYICLDHEALSLHAGLVLNQQFRKYQLPIVLRMAESGGLSALLKQDHRQKGAFSSLHVFDLLDRTCTVELVLKGTHEILARNLHAQYLERVLTEEDRVEDPACVPWEELADDYQEKNRRQADRITLVLEKAGYTLTPLRDWSAESFRFVENETRDEVALMAPVEHALWRKDMEADGWTCGPEKDKGRKTNPNLVPWEELSSRVKEQNKEYIRDLPRILALAGFQIMKKPQMPEKLSSSERENSA
jgi:hypothetical protein